MFLPPIIGTYLIPAEVATESCCNKSVRTKSMQLAIELVSKKFKNWFSDQAAWTNQLECLRLLAEFSRVLQNLFISKQHISRKDITDTEQLKSLHLAKSCSLVESSRKMIYPLFWHVGNLIISPCLIKTLLPFCAFINTNRPYQLPQAIWFDHCAKHRFLLASFTTVA